MTNKNAFFKLALYLVLMLLLITFEVFVYQSYLFIPVAVNNKKFMARKKFTIYNFLKTEGKLPKSGDLLSIDKKILKKGKGLSPVIKVNGAKINSSYYLKPNDKITTTPGADITEPIVTERQHIKTTYRNNGFGALIIITEKGKLGVKEVTYGKYSKKVVKEKVIEKAVPRGISKMNIRKHRVIALTFDDGPSKYTKRILDTLKKYNVKASFFPVGENIDKHPDYLRFMKRHGYTIGNHTFTHINMAKVNGKLIKLEINRADHWIYKATKIRTKWLRPPYGSLRPSVINYIVMRDKKIALWNIDTVDWKRPPVKVIEDRVISQLKPGQIVLMHDGGGVRTNTVKALPAIIKEAKRRHYKFVTLDELYKYVRPLDE